jgi:hypothetical protein
VNCFNFTLSCASIIAIVSNTGGLEYPKSYVLCYVNGQHHHSASLTATLNHEGFLKLEVAMARLFRCKFVAPDNVAIEILVRGLAATGTPAAVAAAAAAAAAVTPPPLHCCSVHDCFGGLSSCGRLPQHRPR